MSFYQKHLFFCTNQKPDGKQCCQNAGAASFCEYAKNQLKARELFGPSKVRVSSAGCLGRCAKGPAMVIYPEGVWYTYQSLADIDEIIERHIEHQEIVERLQIHEE
jgi:(2Fe-2S) ferredoxin